MKTKVYLLLCTVLSATGIFAQHGERAILPKAETRKMALTGHPLQLRNSPMETGADYKPFPDSTITYNLKGEPIGKSIYEYNERGSQTSYKSYVKEEGTDDWIESVKRIMTYDSAGRLLTEEISWRDNERQLWIGNYKKTYVYNSSGQRVLYEYYTWDYRTDIWRGEHKYTTDYETGNERETTYEWDINAGDWIPYERTEYVSETIWYREQWSVSENKWDWLQKIERTKAIDHDKSDVRILIYEEQHASKDDEGKWSEKYTTIRYLLSSIASWTVWDYADHTVSYDPAGNITSVSLTAPGRYSFTTDFTYDYTADKVNGVNMYINDELAESYGCAYDGQGRTIENSGNFDREAWNYKYTYTYIGDSEVRNSVEHYRWDNSKEVFVKESKDMFVRNEEGIITMHQTYSWAETKWVLSSYTIYYPNEYTSDLEFEETEPIGSDNRGAFGVGFNLPQDAEVTGSFYITLPKGFVLDEENTILSDDLFGKYSITITPQEKENTWFVEIKEASGRSMSLYSASSYKKILTVAYQVEEDTKRGDYSATIESLNFMLSDGTVLIEQERDVPITVGRYGVANEQQAIGEINVFAAAHVLTVDSPDAETIHVYTLSGKRVYSAPKAAGKHTYAMDGWTSGAYIVTGSKGWSVKIMIHL